MVSPWLVRVSAPLTFLTACLDQCSECSPTETYTIYANTIPRITMALMQKHEKDVGIAGVNDLNQWPVDSDAFGFLSAASTEPIESLRKVK